MFSPVEKHWLDRTVQQLSEPAKTWWSVVLGGQRDRSLAQTRIPKDGALAELNRVVVPRSCWIQSLGPSSFPENPFLRCLLMLKFLHSCWWQH